MATKRKTTKKLGTGSYLLAGRFRIEKVENLDGGVSISLWLEDAYARGDNDNWVFDAGFPDNRIQAAVVEDSSGDVFFRAGEDPCDILRWNLDDQNPVTLGGWHHWVFIKNEVSGELSLYFDAELVKTKTNGLADTLALIASSPMTVGSIPASDGDFEGKMDDFRVYDHVINQTKIEELFRGGNLASASERVEPPSMSSDT